jgi:glyoxylase-like metal-dependent hydrolase (beta-lactamase superfamily II)
VEDGNRLILIDTGIGDKQDAKFFSHYHLHGDSSLDSSLARHGFHRDDITDVFLTHLHFDHCGGAIIRQGDQLLPAFKNATYWSHTDHWNWAVHPNDREKASFLKDNILPIQESGQLKFIEGDTFTDNFSVRLVNGHTNSMMLPQLKYKGRTIVYMADLLPSAAHLPIPYVMAYDMFPLTTLQEKKSFLTEAVENNYLLYFEHDPTIELAELVQTEKGVRAGAALHLKEL